jgi:hypothetical protein
MLVPVQDRHSLAELRCYCAIACLPANLTVLACGPCSPSSSA